MIVLPALLLAGVGLWSLREDRGLARAEATEAARQLAGDLTVRLAEALQPGSAEVPVPGAGPVGARSGGADPVLQAARAVPPRVSFLWSEEQGLRFPPLMGEWPSPAVADVSGLSDSRRAMWQAAQAALILDADSQAALAGLEAFLSETPPAALAAAAAYELGVLQLESGQPALARPWLETVVREHPEVLGETGIPWRIWAELQLLQLQGAGAGSAAQRRAWGQDVCAEAVLRPSPVSRFLMDRVAALGHAAAEGSSFGSEVETWRQVWVAHEQSRHLAEIWSRTSAGSNEWPAELWITVSTNQSWLVTRAEAGSAGAGSEGGRLGWFHAIADVDLHEQVDRIIALQPGPPYLDLRVRVGGTVIREPARPVDLLALRETSASARGVPSLTMGVSLGDPETWYARQRTRARLFGLLIVTALGVVLVGFLAAWRAFKRQQRVSDMKTNFVSSVSHELRAPIASVRLMAEELEDAPDPGRAREYHRLIRQETRRLSAMLENVLDFARHEQGRKQYEFEPTDLVALVKETVALMKPLAEERQVAIAVTLVNDDVTAEVDSRALQLALVNLVDNAVQHSPSGTTVVVGLEDGARQAGVECSGPRLWVEDSGEGIPAEDHQRIFERFYRRGSELRRQTQGVGLGLALVKATVEAHGGRIHLRSALGQGSRFTLVLPPDPPRVPPTVPSHTSTG